MYRAVGPAAVPLAHYEVELALPCTQSAAHSMRRAAQADAQDLSGMVTCHQCTCVHSLVDKAYGWARALGVGIQLMLLAAGCVALMASAPLLVSSDW